MVTVLTLLSTTLLLWCWLKMSIITMNDSFFGIFCIHNIWMVRDCKAEKQEVERTRALLQQTASRCWWQEVQQPLQSDRIPIASALCPFYIQNPNWRVLASWVELLERSWFGRCGCEGAIWDVEDVTWTTNKEKYAPAGRELFRTRRPVKNIIAFSAGRQQVESWRKYKINMPNFDLLALFDVIKIWLHLSWWTFDANWTKTRL